MMSLATITAMLVMLSVPVAGVTSEQMTVQSSYPATSVSAPILEASTTPSVIIKNGAKLSLDQQKIEQELKSYYQETPILAEIAFCESSYKHMDKEGNVIRGRVDGRDVGVMQINEYYHLEAARKLGYDIHTIEGNMGYAKYLYEKQGTAPWRASEECWGKHVN